MKAVSLDIETLSTTTGSVVLSIGACIVTPDGAASASAFYSRVNIQQQIDAGREISESTLRFWIGQPREVQERTFGQGDGPSVREVMLRLHYWWSDVASCAPVYTKGPQFDAAILDSLADSVKIERPIHYRKWRDLRTLEDMIVWAGHEDLLIATKERCASPLAHDALTDALVQGESIWLSMVLNAMGAPNAAR